MKQRQSGNIASTFCLYFWSPFEIWLNSSFQGDTLVCPQLEVWNPAREFQVEMLLHLKSGCCRHGPVVPNDNLMQHIWTVNLVREAISYIFLSLGKLKRQCQISKSCESSNFKFFFRKTKTPVRLRDAPNQNRLFKVQIDNHSSLDTVFYWGWLIENWKAPKSWLVISQSPHMSIGLFESLNMI